MGCIKSKQGLSQEDLEFLKAHTRYDENTIKEWYKGFKQDCPNGRLTPVKFVDMYKMFFPSGNAEQFCDHVFRGGPIQLRAFWPEFPPAKPASDSILIP